MNPSRLTLVILGLGLSFIVGVQSYVVLLPMTDGASVYWPAVLGLVMAALLFMGVLLLPRRPVIPIFILALAADIGLLTGLFSAMNGLLLWGVCAGLLTLFAFWVCEKDANSA